MSDDVKQALGEMASTFAEFKTANDERLDRIEKGLGDDPLLNDKISKMEEKMDYGKDGGKMVN